MRVQGLIQYVLSIDMISCWIKLCQIAVVKNKSIATKEVKWGNLSFMPFWHYKRRESLYLRIIFLFFWLSTAGKHSNGHLSKTIRRYNNSPFIQDWLNGACYCSVNIVVKKRPEPDPPFYLPRLKYNFSRRASKFQYRLSSLLPH